MYTKKNIIGKTANGLVYSCESCNKFHIVYKNFILNLTPLEYDAFTNYIIILNKEIGSSDSTEGKFHRNITVPTKSESLQIILNNEELEELAYLFMIRVDENVFYDVSYTLNYKLSLN